MLLGCCYSYFGLLVWCDLLFILVLNAGCWFVVLNLVVVFYWFVSVGLFGYVCCGWFNCYFVGCGCLGVVVLVCCICCADWRLTFGGVVYMWIDCGVACASMVAIDLVCRFVCVAGLLGIAAWYATCRWLWVCRFGVWLRWLVFWLRLLVG